MKNKAVLLLAAAIACLVFNCAKDFNNPIDPENRAAVPPTPQNLRVFPVPGANNIQGSFEYAYENAQAVIIERRVTGSGAFLAVDTVLSPAVAFVDTNGTQDTTQYEYRVCGRNSNGISRYSDVATARTNPFAAVDGVAPGIQYFHAYYALHNAYIVDSTHLVLKGSVYDAGSGVKDFTINGRSIPNTGGNWQFDSTLTVFRNRFCFMASDSSGNFRRDTITVLVNYQNVVPQLRISRDTLNHKLIVNWTPVADVDFKKYLLTFTNSLAGGQPAVATDTLLLSADRNADSIAFTPPSLDSAYRFMLIVLDSLDNITSGSIVPAVYALKGMKIIPAGTFLMGDAVYSIEEPVHAVTVSAFCMDSTEVTQADYFDLTGVNPSFFTGNLNRPVESMTWFDAVLYCNAQSKRNGLDTVYVYTVKYGTPFNGCSGIDGLTADFTRTGYRLPTEAEWEYACRAGSTMAFYWGGGYPTATAGDTVNLNANCWWTNNSSSTTHPTAQKLVNAFGLYDMSGNVFEWCNDWFGAAYYGASTGADPQGPEIGNSRVLRGGSWGNVDNGLRSANRVNGDPGDRSYNIGFRCVCR